MNRLLNIQEAATFLSLKTSYLRAAVFNNKVTYLKVGRLIRFRQEDLIDFVEQHQVRCKGNE